MAGRALRIGDPSLPISSQSIRSEYLVAWPGGRRLAADDEGSRLPAPGHFLIDVAQIRRRASVRAEAMADIHFFLFILATARI